MKEKKVVRVLFVREEQAGDRMVVKWQPFVGLRYKHCSLRSTLTVSPFQAFR